MFSRFDTRYSSTKKLLSPTVVIPCRELPLAERVVVRDRAQVGHRGADVSRVVRERIDDSGGMQCPLIGYIQTTAVAEGGDVGQFSTRGRCTRYRVGSP